MATYSTSDHALNFTSDYKKIEVRDSTDTLVATYDLQVTGQSTTLTISSGNFVLGTGADFSEPTNTVDVTAGTTMAFSGNKMGGYGILDLRDLKPPKNYSFNYDLACTVFSLKYVAGPHPFKVLFADDGCFSAEEA